MIINILKLIPKGWDCLIKNEVIEISYKAKKGGGPKPITFFKEILVDVKFMEGLGLFLGDGDLNRKEKRHLSFASKDKDIAKNALTFLINNFNLKISDTTFTIQYGVEGELVRQLADHRAPEGGTIQYLPRYRMVLGQESKKSGYHVAKRHQPESRFQLMSETRSSVKADTEDFL